MITNKELNEVALSPTKKDYYQIWNELMELSSKISERWSPTSTNESDPGIVLLKALTAIADKLNYNIDKNTLEAFMPSATQEDSMRKLTEMMGYDMKHYRSATGKINITYKNSNELSINSFTQGIYFPKFINLKNEDEDVNYVTLEEFTLQAGQDSRDIAIIEGEVIECETNTDNIITALHLDDANRYTLPEYAIAENGIFVTNIKDSKESELWRKEQNLNVQQPGTKVYKVGFDSAQHLPYVQFPEDIKTLIEDGIRIKYIRTNGLNGNISAKTLSKLEKPSIWSTATMDEIKNLSADNFAITNSSACNNGADPESLDEAYNNYKKTIGTFDTLVTCRDYMNKIYQMVESDTDTTPLVSNIIVSDIRDDINRSTPVCTFNEYGICYKDMSLLDSEVISLPLKDTGEIVEVSSDKAKISHFDLIFYPFKTVYGLNNKTEYKNSFNYSAENVEKIKADLGSNKTIAHNIMQPVVGKDDSDIACIKNYLKLKAKVTTTKKVTLIEEAEILNNIYKAIYTNFNARQLEFGEEIPYDTLLSVLKNADYRIKEVNLDEPALNTKFSLTNRTEVELSDAANTSELGKKLYNKLARRNVLAGKISAFKYDEDFISEYDKSSYVGYNPTYPEDPTDNTIIKLETNFDIGEAYAHRDTKKEPDGYVLKENEVIQFRVPNFKTVKTYPAYVNYFIKLNSNNGSEDAIPATFMDLATFMNIGNNWENFVNQEHIIKKLEAVTTIESDETFKTAHNNHVALFKLDSNIYKLVTTYETGITYYRLPINDNIFATFNTWIKNQDSAELKAGATESTPEAEKYKKLQGIYRTVGVQEKPFGRLIDIDLKKYLPAYKFDNVSSNKEALEKAYVQDTRKEDDPKVGTADGFGKDASYQGVPKDGEYQLQEGEYLLLNYTDSKTGEDGVERKSVVNKAYYKGSTEGDVIRANFELIDSSLYHNNHSYSKKDGFSFTNAPQPEGMFTLGTNEQIEIRKIVEVELDEPTMYLYWTLNSDDPEALSNEFKFTESYNGIPNTAYTLKEGEHLYYTNSKKQDLVYYGAGTLIVKGTNTPTLRKYETDGEVSEEDIMTNGLAAAIPWQPYSLSGSQGLKIIENQYISLTEGDILISIDGTEQPSGIDNNWTKVYSPTATVYRFAEDDANSHLPALVVDNLYWEVRSRLDFNMSKTAAQPLHRGDSLTITCKNTNEEVTTLEPITPTEANNWEPVYINTNYTCQSATDQLDLTYLLDTDTKLKLKVSSQTTPKISTTENLTLNNYINGEAKYTKFDFENLPELPTEEVWLEYEENTDKTSADYAAWKVAYERFAFSLNISIPDKDFGLIAIYYIPDADEVKGTEAYIKSINKPEATETGITLFNKDLAIADTLKLRPGLNIVKVLPATKQLEFYSDSEKKSTVVFGSLDIVAGINPKLDYQIFDTESEDTETAKLVQLLADIKDSKVADDFYYNVPIQRANEIDLNAAVAEDKLSSPLSWYDPNNVNRKFVISEIDADYLATGITLTKSSRA